MTKRSKLISFVIIMSGIFALQVSRVALATDLSDDRKGAISQHCATTKQSLRTLQRTDARSRSYLGAAYENLLTNYITPLDLRMISSGRPNANLTTINSSIVEARKQFNSDYTSYSQALEDLIATDCQNDPQTFYNKLVTTREKRANLSADTTTIRNLFSEYLTDVKLLKNSLTNAADSQSTQGGQNAE